MNDQEIEALAKRVGLRLESWMTNPPRPAMWHGSPEALRAFYAEGFRAGMERAAKIAEAPTITPHFHDDAEAAAAMTDLLRMYFGTVAAAIRAEAVSNPIHRQE